MENSFSLVNQRYFPPLGTATKLFKLLQQIGLPVQELGIPILTKRLQHKVILRPLTSDVSAFSQIFIGDEFGRLEIKNPKVILDLGANIGCTSIYSLNRWPDAKIFAVEADPANFPLLVENLKPYGSRATPVLGAVTDYSGYAAIERSEMGHWASRITEEDITGHPTVPAVTLGNILSWVPDKRIDLIKMDIEGAETAVLGWLSLHVPEFAGALLAVELHNNLAVKRFNKLTMQISSDVYQFGEYHAIYLP
jgi:FkbM family methyltransferase